MITLTGVFVHCLFLMGPAISDYNKRMILLSVIRISGGHYEITEMNSSPREVKPNVGFLQQLGKLDDELRAQRYRRL